MRYRGLAQSRGTFPPISQRPLRRSTTYQGQEHSQYSGRDQITGWLGAPRAVAQAVLFATKPGVAPKPGGAKYYPRRWLRAFFHQLTGVAPKPKGSSFPFAGWLRAFFSLRNSGFPLRHTT